MRARLFLWLKQSCFVKVLGFCFVSLLIFGCVFIYMGHLMVVDASPTAAEVGLVLAGDYSRAIYAADLFYQDFIKKEIWITKPHRERMLVQLDSFGIPYPLQEEVSLAILLKKGVPRDKIKIVGHGLQSTLEEARFIAQFIKNKPAIKSILIITTKAHVRRANAIFQFALQSGPNINISVVGSPYDQFVTDQWWRDRDSARQILLELAKLALFLVKTEI